MTNIHLSLSANVGEDTHIAIAQCIDSALEVRYWMVNSMFKVNMPKTFARIIDTNNEADPRFNQYTTSHIVIRENVTMITYQVDVC